jgi:UDPglucose--hexose-1-phosphate uridylyltransferase
VAEFRRDPTTDAWTIIAVGRAARPGGHRVTPPPATTAPYLTSCPFCRGNEEQTPPEILRLPPGAPDWSVRVVPNKYPALFPAEDGTAPPAGDLLGRLPARGHHEVIIEGATHRVAIAPPDPAVLRDVVVAARDRIRAFSADNALRHVSLFKNHGSAGGASLPHPHWQLVASPVLPPAVERELIVAAQYHQTHGSTLLDDLVGRELDEATRIVDVSDAFVVLAAFAPQWVGETWIVPRAAGASIGVIDDALIAPFAQALWRTLRRVAGVLEEPPLNVVIHSAPLRSDARESFRWHTRIQPRLGTRAGFELGSGIAIVDLAPETVAEELRRQPL